MAPPRTTLAQPPAKPRDRHVDPASLAEFLAAADEVGRPLGGQAGAVADPRVELLVFTLGSEDYALPVPILREIVRPPPLSEVPRAASNVLGVTMLRGEVVPVFDPRPRLGLKDRVVATPISRVIIANGASGPLGLWVDSVRQVVRIPSSQLEVPPLGVGGDAGAIASLGRLGERLFGILNLSQLLSTERGGGR